MKSVCAVMAVVWIAWSGDAVAKKNTAPRLSPHELEKTIYLFHLHGKPREEKVADTGAFLKNRVYLRYAPASKEWIFVLTDCRGAFSTPLQALGSGTVLTGQSLGSAPKDAVKRFQLGPDGKWQPATRAERWVLWDIDPPHRLKIVELEKDDGSVPAPPAPPK